MALFGRGTPPRVDDPRKIPGRDASRQFMAVAEELRRAGRLRECIETLERGVQGNPSYVAAHVALARAFQQAELFPRAIVAYQDALKIDRDNLVAVRQLAECYLHQGEKLEALKKLKLFRGLKPGEKEVDEQIARLQAELEAARRESPEQETTGSFQRPGARTTRTGVVPPLPVPPPVPTAPPVPAIPSETPDFDALLSQPSSFESFLEQPPVEAPPTTEPAAAPAPPALPFAPPVPVAPAHVATAPPAPPPVPAAPEPPPPAPVFESLVAETPEPLRVEPSPLPTPEEPAAVFAAPEPVPASEAVLPWEEESTSEAPPVLSAAAVDEEASVPPETGTDKETLPAPPPEAVSETLAQLYRSQGHLADAAKTYERLAEKSQDEDAASAYRKESAALAAAERATPQGRLRALARRLPASPTTRVEEMASVLANLRTRAPGVLSAVLTDLEGLPLVSVGEGGGPASEALVAELTAFWNSVQRTEQEVGAGGLRGVSLRGEAGGAIVTAVSPEYSLILHVERDVPLGRIRYEAARAAGLLRPALG